MKKECKIGRLKENGQKRHFQKITKWQEDAKKLGFFVFNYCFVIKYVFDVKM